MGAGEFVTDTIQQQSYLEPELDDPSFKRDTRAEAKTEYRERTEMARLHILTTSAEDEMELFAIQEALRSLAVLERERLNG